MGWGAEQGLDWEGSVSLELLVGSLFLSSFTPPFFCLPRKGSCEVGADERLQRAR